MSIILEGKTGTRDEKMLNFTLMPNFLANEYRAVCGPEVLLQRMRLNPTRLSETGEPLAYSPCRSVSRDEEQSGEEGEGQAEAPPPLVL